MIGTVRRLYDDYFEIEFCNAQLVIQLPLAALPGGLRQGDLVRVQMSVSPYQGLGVGLANRGPSFGVTLAWENRGDSSLNQGDQNGS